MGQYYMAVVIDPDKGKPLIGDSRGCLKLTEHSWIGNDFVEGVFQHLYETPCRVAWLGDYSDSAVRDMDYVDFGDGYITDHDQFMVYYKGVFENSANNNNLLAPTVTPTDNHKGQYLVNLTKNEFLDVEKYITRSTIHPKWDTSGEPWCLHPLPLLTAVGNGQGGGDYYGQNMKDVGIWAFDKLVVTEKKPDNAKEVFYTFVED